MVYSVTVYSFSAVFLLADKGQPDGRLARMVGNAVGYQCYTALPRHLLHHGGFPDTGRAHQQNGSLSDRRNTVFPNSSFARYA